MTVTAALAENPNTSKIIMVLLRKLGNQAVITEADLAMLDMYKWEVIPQLDGSMKLKLRPK